MTQQPAAQPTGTPAAKSSRLAIPDLISIGIFTALYFVCVCVATLISALVAGAGTIFLPAVAALICGPVFMLSVARVGKFGGITVMGVVIGLFLFVSGHFALSFVASIVFPLAGDLIARIGNYKNRITILIGYVVFCYGLTGPILPLWFMKDAYVASLQARGKDSAYIDNLFSQISVGSFFVAMAAILVCGLIGGWFGQRILKKHFVKAGIA
ncbi:MptD family putative ECF transporter S component [Bifidobacterium amazonense]|uniref:MptD family putative ECF transporter S component n=1 Tax=Bifidobacterium amazonense TaxID=2809027 RepID=A0ABS9VUJ8_9BIFI|nr:MptD family putative ECF transporter S component [Bifidobacterium amazonense]MCH9275774.1 MptD family putative ECF transporter S component [Bifidobacterium amazonense]